MVGKVDPFSSFWWRVLFLLKLQECNIKPPKKSQAILEDLQGLFTAFRTTSKGLFVCLFLAIQLRGVSQSQDIMEKSEDDFQESQAGSIDRIFDS